MFTFVSHVLAWVAPFLIVMMTIVTVHELGHFLAARAFGVAIDRFSIGFGRALFSWRDRAGVEWRIGWLPFGGYVQFAGDENVASVPDEKGLDELRDEIIAREGRGAVGDYLAFKPLWQRAVVAAAGPFANFLLSIAVFAILLASIGESAPPARVDTVEPASAAAAAGFKPGDVILRAADRRIESFVDLERVIEGRANVPVRFSIQRDGEPLVLTATPTTFIEKDILGRDESVGRLGVGSKPTAGDLVRHRYNPVEAVGVGAVRTWQVVDTTVYYLGRLVRGQVSFDQLGGPLRTAQLSHAIASAGAQAGTTLGEQTLGVTVALMEVIAVISVNIGIFNLLPIPVLDGGHLLFYAYEAAARRPMNAAVQAASYRLGLALLLVLMLFATTNDLRHSSFFHFFLGGLFS